MRDFRAMLKMAVGDSASWLPCSARERWLCWLRMTHLVHGSHALRGNHEATKRYARHSLLWLLMLISQPLFAGVVSQAGGNLLLDRSHGGGEAWGKSKCSSCHALRVTHNKVPKIKAVVDKRGFTTCTGCHGSNGTRASRQCLTCHNSQDMPFKPLRGGRHRHDFNLAKDLRTSSKQCVVCHDNSDMDGKFEVDKDLAMLDDPIVGQQAYRNISEFCLRCHNADHQQKAWPIKHATSRSQALRGADHYRKIDAHGVKAGDGNGWYSGLRTGTYAYQSIVDCTDCHTMHGTKNPNLIIEDIRQGAFKLDKSIHDLALKIQIDGVTPQIDKGDYRDLCVTCHRMTRISDGGDQPAPNGLTGVHTDQGTDCVSCHSHGESAQKGL